jgi:hypothetical protein
LLYAHDRTHNCFNVQNVVESFKKIQHDMEEHITEVHEKPQQQETAPPLQPAAPPAAQQVTNANAAASQVQLDAVLAKLDLLIQTMSNQAPAPAYAPHGVALQHLPNTVFPMPLGSGRGLAAQQTGVHALPDGREQQELEAFFLTGTPDMRFGQQQSMRAAQNMLGSLMDSHRRRPQAPSVQPMSPGPLPPRPQPLGLPLADITNSDVLPALHKNIGTELQVGMPPSRKVCIE